jgi:hypothetical protein
MKLLEHLLPISIVLAGLAIGLGLAIGVRRIDARLERDNNFLIYLVSDSWAGTVSKCSDIGMRSCTVMYPKPDRGTLSPSRRSAGRLAGQSNGQ